MMAKELANANVPPDVFQLFNGNRTFYFESDISSLPDPPCASPSPTRTSCPAPVLKKCLSQPQLSMRENKKDASAVSRSSATAEVSGSLQFPTAIMASSSSQDLLSTHDGSHDGSSHDNRYETESSQILKSFRHELELYRHGHDLSKAFSDPTLLHHLSVPDIRIQKTDELHPQSLSVARKLSLVQEETAIQNTRTQTTVMSGPVSSLHASSSNKTSELFTSGPRDLGTTRMMEGPKLPLTTKVRTWFTTSNNHIKFNKSDLNALSPTSW